MGRPSGAWIRRSLTLDFPSGAWLAEAQAGSDSPAVGVSETTSLVIWEIVRATDTVKVLASESPTLAYQVLGSDALVLGLTEVPRWVLTGATEVAASDTGVVISDEAAAIAGRVDVPQYYLALRVQETSAKES